jgi:hypothetical protein
MTRGAASAWSVGPFVPLVALLLAVVANVGGLAAVEDPMNVFRCLNPLGAQQQCVADVRAEDRTEEADVTSDTVSVVVGSRTSVYRELRTLAPDAAYRLSVAAPHIWMASPLLLTSVSRAGDVTMLDSAAGRTAAETLGPLPDRLPDGVTRRDVAVGNTRFRVRLGEAPVTSVFVFQDGREIVFIDMRLLPEPLADLAGADK